MAEPVLDNVLRFLPGALVEWADRTGVNSDKSLREEHFGALMIADASGFTRLTAKLSRESGQVGAERIGLVLNGFVSRLVGAVERFGGAVLSFEGDSLMVGWKSGPDFAALATAVWRASFCAKCLQREMGRTIIEDETLALRCGIAAGTTCLVHLRSERMNARVIMTGPAVRDVWDCATFAESNEILVSRDAWKFVAEHAKGRPTANGAVELLDIEPVEQPAELTSVATSDSSMPETYVPQIVRSRLATSLSRWLSELRTVTTCFVKLPNFDLLDDLQKLEEVSKIFESMSTRYHGDLLRVSASENGLLALAVFGLPGNADKDDPRRASLYALQLQSEVNRIGLNTSIGIATGDSFCGALGTARRAEYTVLGESVNRAARLSTVAAGRVLADDVTVQESSSFISFQGPWSMQVPGIRGPVKAFVALGPKVDGPAAPKDGLIGRKEELQRLTGLFDEKRDSNSRLTVVVGEAGVGKSALANAFTEHCVRNGITVYDGFADDVEQNTPYFAFRRILRRLLELDLLQGRDAYERIEARLAKRPEEISFIPLLADVLDIGLEGSSSTNVLSSSARHENLRRLLRSFLLDGLSAATSVLLIEDVHWLDAASAALLADIMRAEMPITIVLTSRSQKLAQEILRRITNLQYLILKPLDENDTAKLVNSSFENNSIPIWLQQAIWQRTAGNPFFVREICRMIKQRRPETWTRIIPQIETLDEDISIVLPQSARAVVLNRTDTLPSDEQFILKVASAMGPNFTVTDLEAIELIRNAEINVAECIANLTFADLLKAVTAGSRQFTFSHRIIRDVVYASMLSEQKQEVHAAIAKAMEGGGDGSEAEILPIVLNQWQRAGDQRKTFEYLDRVAELRLRQFENKSVIFHSEAFINIAKHESINAPPARLAAAHFVLGEAQLNLGRMDAARASFENGLILLNMRMPQTIIGLALGMILEIGGHLVHSEGLGRRRMEMKRRKLISIGANETISKAARAYQRLIYVHYFHGDKVRLVYSTLRATNLAELAQLLPLLAVNYSSLGAICGVIPLRKRAEHYLKRADELARQLSSPSISANVNLMGGLYETSVGEWLSAKALFEPALRQASSIGDKRRWSEIAVSLETIISPWLLNRSFSGRKSWGELVDKICETARVNGDLQVLGNGLAGAVRGYRILGEGARALAYLDELSLLIRERSESLEPINKLEGVAFLAEAALDRGNFADWERWLKQAVECIHEVNPTIKSRTLTALSAAFRLAMRPPQYAEPSEVRHIRIGLAKLSATYLGRFARIYPIGRPRGFLFRGDLEAHFGRRARAARLWRRALVKAFELNMPADALASLARIRGTGSSLTQVEIKTVRNLDASLLEYDSEFRKVAELTAASLAIGGAVATI